MTIHEEIQALCENANEAASKLALADTKTKNAVLLRFADALVEKINAYLASK